MTPVDPCRLSDWSHHWAGVARGGPSRTLHPSGHRRQNAGHAHGSCEKALALRGDPLAGDRAAAEACAAAKESHRSMKVGEPPEGGMLNRCGLRQT